MSIRTLNHVAGNMIGQSSLESKRSQKSFVYQSLKQISTLPIEYGQRMESLSTGKAGSTFWTSMEVSSQSVFARLRKVWLSQQRTYFAQSRILTLNVSGLPHGLRQRRSVRFGIQRLLALHHGISNKKS